MDKDRPRPAKPVNNKHDKIFSLLFKMAETVEPVGNARLAAAIVYKNEIISFGINKRKTHPFQKKFGRNNDAIFLHAEIDAIKNALRQLDTDELSKTSLYVLRVKKQKGNPKFIQGLARPCENGCMCAIAAFGIKNVYYTTNNNGEFECL